MPEFPTENRERLCKLLGMLGSSHDGERAAAAKACDDLVRRVGCTWADVLGVKPLVWVEPETLQEALGAIWAWRAALTDWELGFVESLMGYDSGRVSEKQGKIIDRLLERCRSFAKNGAAL